MARAESLGLVPGVVAVSVPGSMQQRLTPLMRGFSVLEANPAAKVKRWVIDGSENQGQPTQRLPDSAESLGHVGSSIAVFQVTQVLPVPHQPPGAGSPAVCKMLCNAPREGVGERQHVPKGLSCGPSPESEFLL